MILSIIIPAFNEDKYLPKLLDSIKKQSFKDYEIIVADFNSSDRTREIAGKHGCKIVKGGLPAAGRNNGAKKARGDLLLFIDADCMIKPAFLRHAIKEIRQRNLDAAGCYAIPLSDGLLDNLGFSIFNFWALATQFFYANVAFAIFCKKDLHQKIKGFNEKVTLLEDMDYANRAGKCGKFRILSSARIYTSVRRFEEEGRLKLLIKLFLFGCYRLVFGEITTDIFKYKFGHK